MLAVLITAVGANNEFTVITISDENTCVGVAQLAFDVKRHLTDWPLVSVLVVNVDPVAPPTLIPLICH